MSLQEGLRRRVLEICHKSNFLNTEDIVTHLRSNFREYQRMKYQVLTTSVKHILQSRAKNLTATLKRNNDDDEEEATSASRRRRKRIDDDDDNDDDDDEAESVSTSEGAIYVEKFRPDFDLMNTMLRDSYFGKKDVKAVVEEKNIELEVANSSKAIVEDAFKAGGGSVGNSAKKQLNSKGSVSNGGEVVEVKRKEGPKFKDMGGMKEILKKLMKEVIMPLYHPWLPRHYGVRPVAGILLHGPPGCGKTTLAHAIANEARLPFYHISATKVVSGVSGASEENIRELFSKAYKTAPSIVFIDEIDAIASKRENMQREMDKRIVTELMTCMDQSNRLMQPADGSEISKDRHVLVIGATNRPNEVDPALRRPGRFDREIFLGIPNESAREEILSVLICNLPLEGSFDLQKLARSTPGFVGADLVALTYQAGTLAMNREIDERERELSQDLMSECSEDWWREPWVPKRNDERAIRMSDFEEAVKMVQPSSRREGFSSIPNVKWEDVGGLDLLRQEFEHDIVRRIKYPKVYEEFGVDLGIGILLYGPPGCGKTLIAKAVANEAGANFIHIQGPELINKFVGESELAIRTVFSRARKCSPCIVFFDEVESLTTKRGNEGGWVVERPLNQLLIELDGADQRQGVFVIGATNRPEVMDPAILRPGRFGKLLYVPLPSADERALILKALARKKPIDASVDLSAIGRMEACENLSGADLAALMNAAATAAINERLNSTEATSSTWTIKTSHFELALSKVLPSVSDKQKQYYQHLSKRFKAA